MRTVYRVSPLKENTLRYPSSGYALADAPQSLLFSFDGDHLLDAPATCHQLSAGASETVEQLQWLLSPNTEAERMLKLHVQLARECAKDDLDPETLSQVLQRAGYTTKLHAPPANKLRGLRHQYLTVCLPDGNDSGSSTYIVDPNFKDQFMVAHPTPRYAAVLDALTPEVVATQACLRRAVTILSLELARSFTEQGSPVPPWRTQSALLSKWQLQHASGGSTCGLEGKFGALELGSPAFGRVS